MQHGDVHLLDRAHPDGRVRQQRGEGLEARDVRHARQPVPGGRRVHRGRLDPRDHGGAHEGADLHVRLLHAGADGGGGGAAAAVGSAAASAGSAAAGSASACASATFFSLNFLHFSWTVMAASVSK